jgi:hypothetical protein
MLQAADRITLALIFLNASAFVLATTGVGAPELLKMPLLAGFALFLALVLVAVGIATPLARARQPILSHLDERDGLSAADLRTVLKLAPVFRRAMAVLGLMGLVAAAALFGSVTWTTGTAFEEHHARGFALYTGSLAALLYPVLGALAHLPASLEERLALLRGNDS